MHKVFCCSIIWPNKGLESTDYYAVAKKKKEIRGPKEKKEKQYTILYVR